MVGSNVENGMGQDGILLVRFQPYVRSLAHHVCLVGPVNPGHVGPKHQSLYGNPHTGKDGTLHHTGCAPTHVVGWHMVQDKRRDCENHDHTNRLPRGTHQAPLWGHHHRTRYRDTYAKRTEWYAMPVVLLHTILLTTSEALRQPWATGHSLTTRKQVSSIRSYP